MDLKWNLKLKCTTISQKVIANDSAIFWHPFLLCEEFCQPIIPQVFKDPIYQFDAPI